MITDSELKINGFRLLAEKFGDVLAERFIALIQREPFDYTKSQRKLWKNKFIDEISDLAMKHRKKIINR